MVNYTRSQADVAVSTLLDLALVQRKHEEALNEYEESKSGPAKRAAFKKLQLAETRQTHFTKRTLEIALELAQQVSERKL